MKQTKDEQIKNLTVEFEKLLTMLALRFPEAYIYWKAHLKYNEKPTKIKPLKCVVSNYEPKKRWLNFEEWKKNPNRKTKRILIHNRVTGDLLGEILWDTGWRQYVFDDGHIRLAEGCLYELFEAVYNLRKERENKKEDGIPLPNKL